MDKINSSSISNQRGVALISTILIVAIVVTATAFLSFEQQLWIRQAENISDRARAESVRRGAMQGALILLEEDAKDSTTDDLTEEWYTALLGGQVGDGGFVGTIQDAQSLFNLNSLINSDGKTHNPRNTAMFRRLLSAQSIDPNLVDAVLDWLDKDSQQRAYGAEDIAYLDQKIPYRIANQKFSSVEELRLVQGFDMKSVNKLRNYLTALPDNTTPININTAPPEILKAMFTIPPTDAVIQGSIINKRPFKNKSELAANLTGQTSPDIIDYGVRTAYFNVNVTVTFGRLVRRSVALVHRTNTKTARILWQNQWVPILITEDDESGSKT
ncbi:MAG: GspK family T2SS minor pseudopilin variant XcpX [Gammaproteobacteria bacterium]|nr:MAG: GspK family T2SS minor pseudopilin variant XcpX [Gammaproteobacteria bacterium]